MIASDSGGATRLPGKEPLGEPQTPVTSAFVTVRNVPDAGL